MKQYNVLGIMSGSSLDGLDLCLTSFTEDIEWNFTIEKAETVEIPEDLRSKLRRSPEQSISEIEKLDREYGEWIGDEVASFLKENELRADLIGAHGHTVFHDPKGGVSLQIGDGVALAGKSGIPVVDKFRIDDIKKGGQGAPLVPVGEFHLFSEYDGLINLGGICNITKLDDKVMAWDIAPCNQVLNFNARQLGLEYDRGGNVAKTGVFSQAWYDQLSQLQYFSQKPPKSLSNQWGVKHVIEKCPLGAKDALATYTRFVAHQIADTIQSNFDRESKIMFSGGGAHNERLIQLVREGIPDFEVVVPDKEIVDYKEALIFAFLGLLRWLERPNVFASVTGASSDTIAGSIHHPS